MSVQVRELAEQPTDRRPMGKMTGIAVIVPTYNRANYIGATIESILAQTRPSDQIIVVDDGSTDETQVVLAPYRDCGVTVIHTPNRGVAAARNTGLAHARADYVAFIDSDDLYLPEAFEVLAGYLDTHDEATFVAGDGFIIQGYDTSTRYKPDDVGFGVGPFFPEPERLARGLLRGNLFMVHTVMVRCAAIATLDNPGFDTTMAGIEDWDLWLRLVLSGAHVGRIYTPVALYRHHGRNMTFTHASRFAHDQARLAAKVIYGNLDEWLPVRTRQDYRIRNLSLALKGGGIACLAHAVRDLLWPEHGRTMRPSAYGSLLLLALVARGVRLRRQRFVAHVTKRWQNRAGR